MVSYHQNCPDLSYTVRKNCSSDRQKLLKFEAEGQEFAKFFLITRTIYTGSSLNAIFGTQKNRVKGKPCYRRSKLF